MKPAPLYALGLMVALCLRVRDQSPTLFFPADFAQYIAESAP